MKVVEQIDDFLEANPSEKMLFSKIKQILQTKINLQTARRLVDSNEDIDYLFKIRDKKSLQKTRETLKVVYKNATKNEKQIVGYLLGKKVVFDNSMLAIACHTQFGFALRRKPSILSFKFKNEDEKTIFSIYWTIHIEKKSIEQSIIRIEKMPLKKIFVLLSFIGSEELIENIIDRFLEDKDVFLRTMVNYDHAYIYLGKKLVDLSRKEKLIISKMKIDTKRLVMYAFTESSKKYLKDGNEEIYHDNVLFNELCLKTKEQDEDERLESTISVTSLDSNFKRQKITGDENSRLLRNIKYAWLRIFLISNNFMLFLDSFEKINPDSTKEYELLSKIRKKIVEMLEFGDNKFKKLKIIYSETNECATIEMNVLLKHLKAL